MSKSKQVAAQCECVAHMARALAKVYSEKAILFRDQSHTIDGIEDIVGNHSAFVMEILGDILNGMDAVDKNEDAWMNPVFEEAHRLYPQKQKF